VAALLANGGMALFLSRVSAFRVDRPRNYRGCFGPLAGDTLSLLDPENLHSARPQLLRWYYAVLVLQVIGKGVALYLLGLDTKP
jgi:hypothetical protein